jgi:hypothetical protein
MVQFHSSAAFVYYMEDSYSVVTSSSCFTEALSALLNVI